jgi:phospholipid-binding lipoprotein MlaA
MKLSSIPVLLLVVLTLGCAHGSQTASAPTPMPVASQPGPTAAVAGVSSEQVLPKSPDSVAAAEKESPGVKINPDEPVAAVNGAAVTTPDQRKLPMVAPTANNTGTDSDFVEEANGEEQAGIGIADPLEPFNRAMFQFNDKLYFWVLKPVAQGYGKVVPEPARVSVSNFFSNLTSPIRIVNCLLQANLSGAATELGRFLVNTLWGIGGLMDPAASKDIDLAKQNGDFGQTLGVYGLGQGFYINWPIFGPSSPRDTVGIVGDFFLHPFTYFISAWDTSVEIRAYEKVNTTSLSIGDYESLKEASIDPYVSVRDAYVQYRLKQVNAVRMEPVPVLQK